MDGCVRTVTKIEANPLLSIQKVKERVLRVAAYCRVSTDSEDQLNSYKAQVAYYTDHINKNPKWIFAGIYADEGITGTSAKKRDSFMRMISDCKKGKIDLILTKSVSRFSRNTVDSLNYVRMLKAMNIGVIFEEQSLDTLEESSEMYLGIYSVIAQSESENMSANIRWGINQRMKSGTYAFRYNILGYRKGEDGQPEIVPEEADIIRKIFNMYIEGLSVRQICQKLEANGVKTKSGKSVWDGKIIRDVLQNEKYVGDLLLQKTFRSDCITRKVKKNNGELPKYLVSNNHPAIIDRETFKFVQYEISRRASKRKTSDKTITELGKYTNKYALSERLICGECGSSYRRRSAKCRGETRVYWRCLNRIEHGKEVCGKSVGVEEWKLHKAICDALSSILPNRNEIYNSIISTLDYGVTGNEDTLNVYNIERNIEQLKAEINDLMLRAEHTGGDVYRYEEAIAENYSKIKYLREELQVAKVKAERSSDFSIEIKRLMEIFDKESLSFEKYDDDIIRRIVKCIKVMGDKTLVIILKGGYEIIGAI